jgi:hypothetical protein
MARDTTSQKTLHPLHGGYYLDCGWQDFSGTSATFELTTDLSRVFYAEVGFAESAPGVSIYINETVSGEGIVTSNNALTVTRAGDPFVWSTVLYADSFSSNNLIESALFTAPYAITLTSVVWVNSATAWTGSPVLNIGTSEAGDPDENVDAQAITVTARATTTITTFASAAIASGADVRAISTGGTTTDPAGASLTINGTRTVGSGTKFWYKLIGVD